MQYYYFKSYNNKIEIIVSNTPKKSNGSIYYTELTSVQIEYYLNNPGCSVEDVINAGKPVIDFDLEEYKEKRIAQLLNLSYILIRSIGIRQEVVTGAIIRKLIDENDVESNSVLLKYKSIEEAVKIEYLRIKSLIESAGSKIEVDTYINTHTFEEIILSYING